MVDFKKNVRILYSMMDKCSICPRKCGVNRNVNQKGFCKTTNKIFIASSNIHNGEEPPISAKNGSGAIFFSNCVLSCVFCQNYPISQLGSGNEISLDDLVEIMIKLQNKGVHNINFVTPTHYSAHIVKSVYIARKKGLKIPIIYNCSGYEDIETLRLLEGTVDIYLPDIKYSNDDIALKYSGVSNYVEINRAAIKEMKRQVGNLYLDANGVAKRGIIIRHLVLPGNLENTRRVLDFIAKELSEKTFISLMSQYHPAHNSSNFKELSYSLKKKEYKEALNYLKLLNLANGWSQSLDD
jgi:putative pyruvate formate lyase activating enzyme